MLSCLFVNQKSIHCWCMNVGIELLFLIIDIFFSETFPEIFSYCYLWSSRLSRVCWGCNSRWSSGGILWQQHQLSQAQTRLDEKTDRRNPEHLEWYSKKCLGSQHVFRANIHILKRRLNLTEGKLLYNFNYFLTPS